ncbi:MAG TPA: phosphotransferase [Nocardioidaceae bacterium]|nr:phosphotransferase [Nocardioidaceae bacterium]
MWVPNLADAGWMTEALSRHADALGISGEVTAVQLLDARLTHPHRPGSPRCRGWATCTVMAGSGPPVQLYVKGFSDDDAGDLAWEQVRDDPTGHLARRLPEVGLLVWPFPADPQLVSLPTLVDPRLATDVLPPAVRQVLDLRPGEEPRVTVVRYQPEASATLRLEADRDRAATVFAKLLADGSVTEVAARHQALWCAAARSSDLRLAEPLGVDPGRGVLWTRGLAGGPLSSTLSPDRLPELAAAVGALLAALHAAPLDLPRTVTVDALLVEARKKADKLARAHPAVAGQVHGLVTRATVRRADVDRVRDVTLHGDFHLDQLVGSPDGPVLVDLDSIIRGAPEVDLAEFLVDLSLRGLPGAVVEDVARTLLTSYGVSAGVDVDRALLAVCADAEFVNRCYRHLRRHASGWQRALESELDRHAQLAALIG